MNARLRNVTRGTSFEGWAPREPRVGHRFVVAAGRQFVETTPVVSMRRLGDLVVFATRNSKYALEVAP